MATKPGIRKMLSADSQDWLDALIAKKMAVTLAYDSGIYTVNILGEMEGWAFHVLEQGKSLEWTWFLAAARVGMNTGEW